ncbi:hypothetical protein [Microbacterium sp. A84]|uniref:hypothetical protein n=1 Tax=Microbacterium sp. A84 TaxID=3450715 RepID=UPI003F444F1E
MIYDPDKARKILGAPEFSLAQRWGGDLAQAVDWDNELLREPRVCVPIDVQALVVLGDDPDSAGVRLDGPLTPGRAVPADAESDVKRTALTGSDPFDEPAPRETGIHLHWAMPDALMKGRASDGAPAARDLGMAPLPDRWVITRILVPATGTKAVTQSWAVDALTGAVWPLGESGAPAPADTESVAAGTLNGTSGGTLTWTAAYDAARGRFTFHDSQDDLARDATLGGTVAGGPVGGRATYLVVGWWADADLDPLDGIHGTAARGRRLTALKWKLVEQAAPNHSAVPTGAASTSTGTPSSGASVVSDSASAFRYKGVSVSPSLLAGLGIADAQHIRPANPPRPEASTLLHGAVIGVPALVEGARERVAPAEQRPSAERVSIALGSSLSDALGALAVRSLAPAAVGEERELFEELVEAFIRGRLTDLDDPAGAAEIDEGLHSGGFETVASPFPGVTDRLVDGAVPLNDQGRRIGTVRSGVFAGIKKADSYKITADQSSLYFVGGYKKGSPIGVGDAAQTATVAGAYKSSPYSVHADVAHAALPIAAAQSAAFQQAAGAEHQAGSAARKAAAAPRVRTEVRPEPPFFQASDPYLLVRGAGRFPRHGGDGAWLDDGRLKVRSPSLISDHYKDVLAGSEVLAPLASGAIPAETTALAREALLLSDFASGWLAQRAAEKTAPKGRRGPDAKVVRAYERRFEAELLLRYDESGAYTGDAVSVSAKLDTADPRVREQVTQGLLYQSVLGGTSPSPVGITAWAQPWCPLWLEYRVDVEGRPGFAGWDLGSHDFTAVEGPSGDVVRTAVARVPLTTGVAHALGDSIGQYLKEERTRDADKKALTDDELVGALGLLRNLGASADLLGASLDGVRRRMLGLLERAFQATDADGEVLLESAEDPVLLLGGAVRVTGLRVVDTYGRVLDLDPQSAIVPARLEAGAGASASSGAGAMLRAPRFTPPTRVRVRFVGAESTGVDGARDARIDESDASAQVSPVCGFLLPDHVDESIEVFGPDATALGELLVTGQIGSSGGGVIWEPAPGRPVPADAAPSVGLLADEHVLGRFATGIVVADAAARGSERATPDAESALAALLRSIDTTLWTVDGNAGAGSAQLASIVGAPLAVVRAVVSVDLLDDTSSLALSEDEASARRAAYADLSQDGVPVRLGALSRPDDGLVAWFVDDDYSRVHLVDKAILNAASPAGHGKGFLQGWGVVVDPTGVEPITHEYVSSETELIVHPGVPRMLTLLMTPGAAVHFTSGIVPQGRVQLQRGWFTPALDELVPAVRVGPVLIDPGDVRLPLVAALGENQSLTVREGPTAWRDDAILAATQSAVLPDRATVLREGWIRVSPGAESDRR